MNNEFDEAMKVIAALGDLNLAGSNVQALPSSGRAEVEPSATVQASTPVQRLVIDVSQLVTPESAVVATTSAPAKRSESSDDDGGSTAATVLKTVGMVAGVGPLVTGLFKLFGGGSDNEAEQPSFVEHTLPQSVNVEAGLDSERRIGAVRYATGGTPQMQPVQQASIQVNINALDSRSFLDRSDEIAQALRQAILHSHPVNDVVTEI